MNSVLNRICSTLYQYQGPLSERELYDDVFNNTFDDIDMDNFMHAIIQGIGDDLIIAEGSLKVNYMSEYSLTLDGQWRGYLVLKGLFHDEI